MNYQNLPLAKRKAWFLRFAEKECLNVSPFYYDLSNKIAEDVALLNLAGYCRQGQPMPNLFLGAVHFLLLANLTHELATYYPSINPTIQEDLPFPLFRDFCGANEETIKHILATKIVQTNALNRTAYLMPIVFSLFESGTAINLIDIGTSAGLTLNLDLYEYDYGDKRKFGNSLVKINCEIRSGKLPKFAKNIRINNKIGIDQNPLDVKDSQNALWLKALIWPDRSQRFERMAKAIELAQTSNIQLVKAVEIADFKRIIKAQSIDTLLVVYHTHVLYQFSKEARIAFWQMLDTIGQERDFYYLAAESASVLEYDYGLGDVLVELTTYQNGVKSKRLVARTNGHANWVKWNV